ncbi:MAG: M48 family metalloprotease [Saprospiraceae bacterium]
MKISLKNGILALFVTLFCNCSVLKKSWDNLNVFPVQQDIDLGNQVAAEILSNPDEYPIVPVAGNEAVYSYTNGIVKKILATNLVDYSRDFSWNIHIINDPKTLNAFCTPGGNIYIYTGLMSFLDSEDQFAGVIGHEMAHAANRHSTKQLTKSLGVQLLLDAALGNKDVVKQVTGALVNLSFSRAHETQADSFSVKYLCLTGLKANGASGFFKKIEGQPTPPQWLSTHPSPTNRVKAIDSKALELGCKGKEDNKSNYEKIKSLIASIPVLPTKAKTADGSNKAPSLPNSTPSKDKKEDKAPPSTTNTKPTNKVLKKGK